VVWLDFKRGVKARSGHGSAEGGERRSRFERAFASLGKNERPREKQDKTGPANEDK